jgi:acetyl-CoA carboxylase/biotin carboxylase 1
MIYSHHHIAKKNQLIIMLIEHVSTHELVLIQELKDILTELTQLGKQEHSRVALQSRQVRVSCRLTV